MALAILALGVGLALLAWSADRFLDGSDMTARHLGLPPLLIGMLIVSFGTSAPGTGSADGGDGAGCAAVIRPMAVPLEVIQEDIPVTGGLTLFLFGFGAQGSGHIGRLGGLILLAIYLGYNAWLVRGMVASLVSS